MSNHVDGVEKAIIVKTSAQLKMSLAISVRKEDILAHNVFPKKYSDSLDATHSSDDTTFLDAGYKQKITQSRQPQPNCTNKKSPLN